MCVYHIAGSITWLCFFKDKLLLSASEDGCVCVWRCGGGWDLLHILTGHKYVTLHCVNHYEYYCCRYGVSCVAVHPSGKLTLSVGKDRILRYLIFRTYIGNLDYPDTLVLEEVQIDNLICRIILARQTTPLFTHLLDKQQCRKRRR